VKKKKKLKMTVAMLQRKVVNYRLTQALNASPPGT